MGLRSFFSELLATRTIAGPHVACVGKLACFDGADTYDDRRHWLLGHLRRVGHRTIQPTCEPCVHRRNIARVRPARPRAMPCVGDGKGEGLASECSNRTNVGLPRRNGPAGTGIHERYLRAGTRQKQLGAVASIGARECAPHACRRRTKGNLNRWVPETTTIRHP